MSFSNSSSSTTFVSRYLAPFLGASSFKSRPALRQNDDEIDNSVEEKETFEVSPSSLRKLTKSAKESCDKLLEVFEKLSLWTVLKRHSKKSGVWNDTQLQYLVSLLDKAGHPNGAQFLQVALNGDTPVWSIDTDTDEENVERYGHKIFVGAKKNGVRCFIVEYGMVDYKRSNLVLSLSLLAGGILLYSLPSVPALSIIVAKLGRDWVKLREDTKRAIDEHPLLADESESTDIIQTARSSVRIEEVYDNAEKALVTRQ